MAQNWKGKIGDHYQWFSSSKIKNISDLDINLIFIFMLHIAFIEALKISSIAGRIRQVSVAPLAHQIANGTCKTILGN